MQETRYHNRLKLIFKNKKISIYFFTLLISALSACSQSYEITTWNEWCAHITHRNSIAEDRGLVSYNLPKIRADFVKDYNEILVEEVVSNHFWDSTIHSNVEVEKLIADHQLGLWMEGNQLHFSNTHLTHEDFEGDVERFKKFLSFDVLNDNRYHLNHFQLCLYKAVDSMFETFTIHTQQETTTIKLDFSYRGFLEK
jgi:hypothetical protein